MFIGLGMPIPDLSNKPGPGRPGFGPIGSYDFQFRVEGAEAVVIKANAPNNTGTFRISWPNGTTQELSGNNASITAPDATDGIVSINNEELDTTYMDDFAVIGAKGVVREVISWGKNPWNRLSSAFKDCTNLTTFGITSLQTDAFADLDFMFEGCTGLTEANLSSWNNTLGFRGRQMFKDCTNISQVTWSGVVKLVQTIAGMFNNVGSNVAAGCNFQTNNLDFRTSTTVTIGNTDTGGGGMFTNALIDADSSNISNWDFRTSIANINMFHAFRNARVVGDDKTLNISNWKMDCTNLIQYTLMFDQFNEDPGNVRTDHNIALNMTGWQFGSGTTRASLTQAFRFSNFRKIIGLNTWTSGVVSRVDYAFQQPLFWAIQEGDNFNDTFWENSAIENGFTGMFSSHGLSLAESDWGESPNIKGLSKSPTVTGNTTVAQMFNSTRYTTTLYFDNVDIATGYGAANGTVINYHIHNIKIKKNGAVSGGVDYSNANIKFVGSSFANWATAEISFLTFGSGIDFTLMTNWTAAFNSSFPDWPLTFATNLNLTNLTTIGLSRTLTPCQADNFIRAVHDTTFAIGAPTPFSFSLASSQITNSPSVVNTKLLALAAAGYSITDGNPGTTMPFAYTTPITQGVDQTPTGSFTGGTFSSSDAGNIPVNAATGEIDATNAGNVTIRYTITATGCYNEQALVVNSPLAQIDNAYSMEFDGVNDSINVGLIEPFNNAVSNFAISYWVKANFSTTQCHFDFRYNGANRGVALENNASTIFFYTGGNFATTWSTATSGLNNNEWNHIIINFDGSIATDADKCEFWINGVKKTNSVQSAGNSSTTAITGNGFLGSGFSFKLTGGLDEFSTFNTTLTQEQVTAIYNATAVVDGVNKTADLSTINNTTCKVV